MADFNKMYQCSFPAHFHGCTHARSTIGVGGAAGLPNLGICDQYAGQRVRMSFSG